MHSSSEQEAYQHNQHRGRQNLDPMQESGDILLNSIVEVLRNAQDHQSLASKKNKFHMKLRIVEKKPMYVADGFCCVQASFKTVDQITLNPFNRGSNQFYANHQRPHIVFNCFDQNVPDEPQQYPTPYHPCYHFKNYDNFKNLRKSTKILLSCQCILVKEWSVQIVNISGSGYYGPLLIIHSYDNLKSSIIMSQPVQNILFTKSPVQALQNFRLKDMRESKYESFPLKTELAYYMRNQIAHKKSNLPSVFVSLDTKGESIKYRNNKEAPHLVPLGSAFGFCMFKRPVQPRYLGLGRQKINFQKFAYVEEEEDEDERSLGEMSLWEDEEYENRGEEGGEIISNEQLEQKNEMQEEISLSDSEQSDEDPLRSAYTNQLRKNRASLI